MADAHAKNHDYHLVDPSPWPVVGSISALATTGGAVMWMHDHGPVLLIIGVGLLAYTFFAWWKDVINEGEHKGDHTPVVGSMVKHMENQAAQVLFLLFTTSIGVGKILG